MFGRGVEIRECIAQNDAGCERNGSMSIEPLAGSTGLRAIGEETCCSRPWPASPQCQNKKSFSLSNSIIGVEGIRRVLVPDGTFMVNLLKEVAEPNASRM